MESSYVSETKDWSKLFKKSDLVHKTVFVSKSALV